MYVQGFLLPSCQYLEGGEGGVKLLMGGLKVFCVQLALEINVPTSFFD